MAVNISFYMYILTYLLLLSLFIPSCSSLLLLLHSLWCFCSFQLHCFYTLSWCSTCLQSYFFVFSVVLLLCLNPDIFSWLSWVYYSCLLLHLNLLFNPPNRLISDTVFLSSRIIVWLYKLQYSDIILYHLSLYCLDYSKVILNIGVIYQTHIFNHQWQCFYCLLFLLVFMLSWEYLKAYLIIFY